MADLVREHEHKAQKESGDIRLWPVLGVAVAWLAFICVGCGLIAVLYYKFAQPTLPPSTLTFPAPRLDTKANEDYFRMVAGQKQRLTSYGWIDRKAGTVHVPIARAMADLLKRSDPYAPLAKAPAHGGSGKKQGGG